MIYRGSGFLAGVWFGSSTLSLTGDTLEAWERETTCWRERSARGGWGAESYDSKNAWSSVNHQHSARSNPQARSHPLPVFATLVKNLLRGGITYDLANDKKPGSGVHV